MRSLIGIMSQHEQGIGEDTAASTSDLAVKPVGDLTGTTLGDFQVRRLLGQGGMGQVYLATQVCLNRPVALKVLYPWLLSKPAYLSRFEAEATAVAKLNHPNIVHVYAVGCVDETRYVSAGRGDQGRSVGGHSGPTHHLLKKNAYVGMGQSLEVALGSRDGDAARWVSEQGPWLS